MISSQKSLYALLTLGLMLWGPAVLSGCAQKPDSTQKTPQTETQADTTSTISQESDVPYVPTPEKVVARMLELADVAKDDTVYDLGSGDGRIVIAAAEQYGAHGVGVEINAGRVEEARQNAQEAGVSDLVEFRQGDLFEADLSQATAVTLYLLPSVNLKLRKKLFEDLEPGTPVVSHDFDMGEWEPEQTVEMNSSTIYRWTIPEAIPENLRETGAP